MAACGGCGRNLADGVVRCMYCGASKAPPKACPKCSRKLDPQAIRCIFCNIQLKGAAPSGPDPRAIALARGELFQNAERLRKGGQPSAALGLLDQVVLADRTFVPALLARGKCLAILGDPLGASDAARAALKLEPRHPEAQSLFGTWSKAAAAMSPRAVEAAAEDVVAIAREANAHAEAGRHADALVLFDAMVAGIAEAARDHPSLAALHTSRGLALQNLRRLPEALASFAEALRVDARYALAWQNQASALDDAGRVKEAALSAERAVELDHQRVNAWVDLGFYRKKLGDPQRAMAAYQQALALDPGHPVANVNVGNVLFEAGDLDGAERAYRAALATSPSFAHAAAALERVADARRAAPASRGQIAGPPPGLPPGRPYKTAIERAGSSEPVDRFFTHAVLALKNGELARAKILGLGWICVVPGQPGAEILADLVIEGPELVACRSVGDRPRATLETLGKVDFYAARDLLDFGIVQRVTWVIDREAGRELLAALAEVEAVIRRAGAMRIVVIPPA